jgi:hypothetical protein
MRDRKTSTPGTPIAASETKQRGALDPAALGPAEESRGLRLPAASPSGAATRCATPRRYYIAQADDHAVVRSVPVAVKPIRPVGSPAEAGEAATAEAPAGPAGADRPAATPDRPRGVRLPAVPRLVRAAVHRADRSTR